MKNWKEKNRQREKKHEEYLEMTPVQKLQYLCDGIKTELKKTDLKLDCHAGREFCIECSFSEISKYLKELE